VNGIFPKAAVIGTAAVFGLIYSLSATLIALDLMELGMSETFIGANAAMHAVGVLGMAFLLPRIAAFFGIRETMIGSLFLSAVLLILFPAMPAIWLWFPLRILLGAVSEALFVLSETWLNALSKEENRAKIMGIYTAALSVGFALGPMVLSVVGTKGFAPFITGALLTSGAAFFVMAPSIKAPRLDRPSHGNPLIYMRMAPLALAATALNAAVETAGLSFLSLYALALGWQESQATQLMSCLMFGAIVLQLPVGWLGDRMDRRKLLIILAGLAALGALAWPLILQNRMATYVLLFIWGGMFVGTYTVMLAIIGSKFKGSDLVGVYAATGLFWGGGALAGPLLTGAAMEITVHGLAFFAAASCAVFMVMAIVLRKGV